MNSSSGMILDLIRTGERIRNIINERGYRVKEVQEMLYLSCPQPVYRWMKGKNLPTVENLYVMSRIFQIHMEDMLVPADEAEEVGMHSV